MPQITCETITAKILAQRDRFARQGVVVSTYRMYRGRKLGPYFRLAYRDEQNRQRSIYLGRSADTASRIQSLLETLKAPLLRHRQCHRTRTILFAALRRHKNRWKTDLHTRGLYLKGFTIRGWRRLHSTSLSGHRASGRERARVRAFKHSIFPLQIRSPSSPFIHPSSFIIHNSSLSHSPPPFSSATRSRRNESRKPKKPPGNPSCIHTLPDPSLIAYKNVIITLIPMVRSTR